MAENQGQPQTAKVSTAAPFTVEFANNNGAVQCLRSMSNRKFRGRWDTADVTKRENGRRDLGPMGSMPVIPGLHLRLDPLKYTVEVIDPLDGDAKKITEIQNAFARATGSKKTIKIEERVTHNFGKTEPDKDRFKTLVIELGHILASGHLVVVNGQFPSAAEIKAMPGRELYDPARPNKRPRYADEADDYFERMTRVAGVLTD
jgi:hypothetical protein